MCGCGRETGVKEGGRCQALRAGSGVCGCDQCGGEGVGVVSGRSIQRRILDNGGQNYIKTLNRNITILFAPVTMNHFIPIDSFPSDGQRESGVARSASLPHFVCCVSVTTTHRHGFQGRGYFELADPLNILRTAWAMASRSMPKILRSSWGLPLRGTWATARRWMWKLVVSLDNAEHTASPRPPS